MTLHLWLDDERDPNSPTTQTLFHATGQEVWVKTAQEAISLLQTGKITHISLDHDLGEHSDTGMTVAKYIEEAAFHGTLPRLEWTVHSMNPIGRKNMEAALTNANRFWEKSCTRKP